MENYLNNYFKQEFEAALNAKEPFEWPGEHPGRLCCPKPAVCGCGPVMPTACCAKPAACTFTRCMEQAFFLPRYRCLGDYGIKCHGLEKVCRFGCHKVYLNYTFWLQYIDCWGKVCWLKKPGCLFIGDMLQDPCNCREYCVENCRITGMRQGFNRVKLSAAAAISIK